MTATLSLTGCVPTPGAVREWLARAGLWFETAGDAVLAARPLVDENGSHFLEVALHPAVGPVELRLAENGLLRVAATTGPAGPGYHAFLSTTLDLFAADFGITWEKASDSTGFREAADPDGMVRHFLEDLRVRCRALIAAGPEPIALGLAVDHGFTHPGPVLTPLGPRSRAWLNATAADPELGLDVFPWWTPALDADFFRNRALTALWCDFTGRSPLTEDEGELLDQIAADLDLAYALDPSGPIPWRAWAEVVAALDGDRHDFAVQRVCPQLRRVIQEQACQQSGPKVGYRRYPIRLPVGNSWTIEVPGSFAEGWDSDGTWLGWDARRRVAVRTVECPTLQEPTIRQCRDEMGRRIWRLEGVLMGAAESLSCRVDVLDAAERDWAASVWKSLRIRRASEGTASVA